MIFDIVVAADREGGIGAGGDLPWRLPGDMKRFVEITRTAPAGAENAVVMGRVTWESIPERFRPLADRKNIVLTRRGGDFDGAHAADSLERGLSLAVGCAGAFVIGGALVYREALSHPSCRHVYLTRVDEVFSCDAFLPPLPADFELAEAGPRLEENGIGYRFQRYTRSA